MNFAPEFVGVGKYNGEIAQIMGAAGIDIEAVSTPPHYPDWAVVRPYRNRYRRERVGAATVRRCPILIRRRMGGIWRLLAPVTFALTSAPVAAWRILAWRPQVVLCIEPTIAVAPVALLCARLVGARTMLHVQDLEVDAAFAVGHVRGPAWLRRVALAGERFLLRRFDRVVTISSAMAAQLAGKGVAPARLSIIRNWVDLDRFQALPRASALRDELGISDAAYVVLYSGSIGAKQELEQLLEAAHRLEDVPGIVVVVAGEGPAKAGLVARYGDRPNVRFLPFQPDARLNAFLNIADLHALIQGRGAADLVLPSKLGGMLATGRPVLATADAGTEIADFLGDDGIIVAPRDPVALAAAIRAASAEHVPSRPAVTSPLAGRLSSATASVALLEVLVELGVRVEGTSR